MRVYDVKQVFSVDDGDRGNLFIEEELKVYSRISSERGLSIGTENLF